MTNYEKMNEQLSALADLMKLEYTLEELKNIEEAYDRIILQGNKEYKDGAGED